MEDSKNYGHHHPLVRLDEDQLISNPSGVPAHCSRCGDKVSAPCFSCAEDCGFYLDKVCADAPSELNHPFHRHHPLVLRKDSPYSFRGWVCEFCDKRGEEFVYHCCGGLNLHLKCALLTFNIAEHNLKELEHLALQPPLISNEIEDVRKCFGCWEPLANYTYFSPDCGFNLHKKCAELPLKLNHMCHREHPLLLQFNSKRLSCKICQETQGRGFVYGCSPCKFAVHIQCVSPSPPPFIEDKSHPHPFTLFWRRVPFICDACGTEGHRVAYKCGTCSIIVHKKCISLPPVIKSKWHDHHLFHPYFLYKEDFVSLDCLICHDEVNAKYGSYSCSKCNVVFHVNCAMKHKGSYSIVENEDEESLEISVSAITDVLEQNDVGEATIIQHFKHIHRLILSDRVSEYGNKCCDGCLLRISTLFYYCLQCDFFLHKICAELPKVKHVWHHRCQKPLVLTSGKAFQCALCGHWSYAFSYECEERGIHTCLRCIIALTPGAQTCVGHKHSLLFYHDYRGQCIACGANRRGMFRCKECNFSLDHNCFSLPITIENKCDEHPLSLTYYDNNNYPESYYCDICEEGRDSSRWYYHCATCDTSAHVGCALGMFPFLKLGHVIEVGGEHIHEHPIAIVKKIYYYPDCNDCDRVNRGVVGYYTWKPSLLFGRTQCVVRDGEEGEMEDSNNYGHHHSLVRLDEDQLNSNPSGVSAECSRCGEKVSAPCFGCAEDCGFYLDEVCAEAPLELNHPFHPHHPLLLNQNPNYSSKYICDFCDKEGDKFFYHCSCDLAFHIRCVLFTFDIAESDLKKLEHVALEPPMISSKKDDEQLEDDRKCFGCWEPLAKYTYFSPDCGFNLHKKCADLSPEIKHMDHREHPLVLQFNSEQLSCKICHETAQRRGTGFVYSCSRCKFAIHIECVAPSPIPVIEDKRHQHPFTLFWRQAPFICDACGTEGGRIAYTCDTCSIIVHKKCISLPRIIKSKWHDHCLFHTYFLYEEDFKTSDCIICHEEVNTGHGSYSCSKCNAIFHVNCVTGDKDLYFIVENEEVESLDISVNSITNVLEWNDAGEAIVIQHFKHNHHLMLSDRVSEYENKCCDGCVLPISTSFYYCLQCDFFLHKVCAELSKVKHVWYDRCQKPLVLTSGEVFRCVYCGHWSNAFAYFCEECGYYRCLRCVIAFTPGGRTCLAHEHTLFYYTGFKRHCNACGVYRNALLCCKECNFDLDHVCFSLPITVENKCDEHLLSLTHHENNSYSESHYCDICEEGRDPKLWFYHCAKCGTSAHVYCVLGQHPFLKPGSVYEENDHPHPLTFVKKSYYYPDCDDCGKRCEDLALECTESGYMQGYREEGEMEDSQNYGHQHPLLLISSLLLVKIRVIRIHSLRFKDEHRSFVLERNDAGEATKIKHFKHDHNLMLSPLVGEHEKSCDGCMLPISDPFFSCSQCDFLLHKVCADLPRKKHVWHHDCLQPLILISDKAFKCEECWHVSNAFAYVCCGCEEKICLQSNVWLLLLPGLKHVRNMNTLSFSTHIAKGNAMLVVILHREHFVARIVILQYTADVYPLPSTARHKFDEHLISLTYHDDNSYSESHYCDICEESRDPNPWFYRCETCNFCSCRLRSWTISFYETREHLQRK
ncbi:hypothetical protein GQ457_01G034520 [Hibiscus cannabinus]